MYLYSRTFPLISREFVIVLEPFVSEEAEFVQHFLSRPRKACQPCFKQQREEAGEEGEGEGLRAIHPEGNLLAVLQEVGPAWH